MNIYKATIEDIKPGFEIKACIHVWPNIMRTEKLALKGVEAPSLRSKQGRAMHQHLANAIESVPFLVIQIYEKDARLRYLTDFYYLPGENDPERIVRDGRHLNKELLRLDLAKPYDEDKRKIDFSHKTIEVFDEEINLVTGNFKAEVCMYINDCKQYLKAALEGRPVDMMKGEFDPTDEEFLIVYGMKELKDLSMRLAGRRPLKWEGN